MAYRDGRVGRDAHADARWVGDVVQQETPRPSNSQDQISFFAGNGLGGRQPPRNTHQVNEIRNRGTFLADPRERLENSSLIRERAISERERLAERPWVMERHSLEEGKPKDLVPLQKMVDLAGRVLPKDVHRNLLRVLRRGGRPTETSRHFDNRQSEGERAGNISPTPPSHQSGRQQILPLVSSQPQNQHLHGQLQHEQSREHFESHSRSPAQHSHQPAHQQFLPLVSSGSQNQHLHGQLQHEQRQPMQMSAHVHQAQQFSEPESQFGKFQVQLEAQQGNPFNSGQQQPPQSSQSQLGNFQVQLQAQQVNPFNSERQQPPQSSQSLNSLIQAWAPIGNGPSVGSVQSPANQNPNFPAELFQSCSSDHQNRSFPAEFFESRPMSSIQSVQSLPQLQGASPVPSRVMTTSLQPTPSHSNFLTEYPPLPSWSPPIQTTNFREQQQGYFQPPLPPGPPSASTTSTVSGVGFANAMLSLLNLLVPQGVIGAPVAKKPPTPDGRSSQPTLNEPTVRATPHSPENSKTESIGIEFKQELLRKRHEYVVDALYSDFPTQCMTCGLRFKAREEHSKHMDGHVSKTRRKKSQKRVSRDWFVSTKAYICPDGTSSAAGSEFAPSIFENTELVTELPADENYSSSCALCGERLECFYSDEADDWMYKGVVYLNDHQGKEGLDGTARGPIVHKKCKKVLPEMAAVDNRVQPELQSQVANGVPIEIHRTGNRAGEAKVLPFLDKNFGSSEMKEEHEDLESRRKRTRY